MVCLNIGVEIKVVPFNPIFKRGRNIVILNKEYYRPNRFGEGQILIAQSVSTL